MSRWSPARRRIVVGRNGDRNGYLTGPALYTLSGNEQTHGTVFTGSAYSRMTYDNTRAYTGSQSIKCQLVLGQPPATCGGSVWFGGRFTLPTAIPAGYSIWYRARFYLPSTLPMGYCFGTSDSADAATCSQPSDGSGYAKWLVLAPDTGTARLYTLLNIPRRAMGLSTGLTMISEPQNTGNFEDVTTVVPRDQWFSLQMQAYLQTGNNAGYLRLWLNDTYIGQHTKETLDGVGYKIDEWGIGDYWNGVPWTDGGGGRTDSFWMDDVIIATDYSGYGAPTAVDGGGRPYIPSSATVDDV